MLDNVTFFYVFLNLNSLPQSLITFSKELKYTSKASSLFSETKLSQTPAENSFTLKKKKKRKKKNLREKRMRKRGE